MPAFCFLLLHEQIYCLLSSLKYCTVCKVKKLTQCMLFRPTFSKKLPSFEISIKQYQYLGDKIGILWLTSHDHITYSEIPLLRPPKIKTFYLLETLFAKFKLFFSSFSTPSVPLIRDHLWDCPKVVFKTTFGQSPKVVLI